MSKVLIVDDELYVCELVRHLIHWEALGLQSAGTAHSANEAVELIRRERPEIIISDIKMPGCSGFDLIGLARELVPNCNFILISGHKNFQYAHDALKLSVKDYILKPINEEELNNTLQKLADELHLKEQQRNQSSAMTCRLSQNRQKLEDCFIRDVAAGRPPNSAEQAAEKYSLQLSDGPSAFWILRVDTGKKRLHRSSPYMLYQKLQSQCQTLLAGVCGKLIVSIRRSGLILFLNDFNEPMAAHAADSLITMALDTVSAFADSTATLSVSLPFNGFSDSCAAYQSARLCIYARVRLGSGRVLNAQDYSHRPADPSGILTPAIRHRFRNAIETLNGTFCQDLVDGCSAQACAPGLHPALPYLLCEQLLDDLEHTVRTHLELPDPDSFFSSAHSYLDYAADVDELRQVMLQAIEEVLQHNAALRNRRGREIISAAKSYVSSHYQEPIRLEDVAREVFLSPSYFSTLFKKETSENFVDYVTAYRMEQAKQLLRSTNVSVAEVGTSVGIPDGRYFSRLFTKTVGLKPSVYRRLYH